MKKISIRLQLFIIVGIIIFVSVWRIYEKITVMGFSLDPKSQTTVWHVEAKISFTGEEKPVKVYLTIPSPSPGIKILEEESGAAGYGYKVITTSDKIRRALWTRRNAKGPQELFYKISVYDNQYYRGSLTAPQPPIPALPTWEGSRKKAALKLLADAEERTVDDLGLTDRLLDSLNSDSPSTEVKLIFSGHKRKQLLLKAACDLLAYKKIPSRFAYGITLKSSKKVQRPTILLEIYSNGKWHVINPETGSRGVPANFLLFRRGGESLLDVVGGKNSRVDFSVIESVRSSYSLAENRAASSHKKDFFDFSIYSLPVEGQNAFKWLSILPLAILVTVLLRNVFGFLTMGTFTPILISMAFLETTLVPGIVCFLVIVSLGLVVRFYLSKLNLLLVPRISAVVIVVIILMELVSIVSYKTGLLHGLKVTYFPLIILAWVIERSSILWEEDGAANAMKQIIASLIAAIIAYFIISNEYVKHVMFTFGEINLIILGLVLLLGTYSGYRLSELYRFKPLVDNKKC